MFDVERTSRDHGDWNYSEKMKVRCDLPTVAELVVSNSTGFASVLMASTWVFLSSEPST